MKKSGFRYKTVFCLWKCIAELNDENITEQNVASCGENVLGHRLGRILNRHLWNFDRYGVQRISRELFLFYFSISWKM